MIFWIDENRNTIVWADGVANTEPLILEASNCDYYGSPIGFDIYVGF